MEKIVSRSIHEHVYSEDKQKVMKKKWCYLCTRNTSAQSHKGNGIDGVFKVDKAAKMTGHVTNDCGAQADEDNGYEEGWISIIYGCT